MAMANIDCEKSRRFKFNKWVPSFYNTTINSIDQPFPLSSKNVIFRTKF